MAHESTSLPPLLLSVPQMAEADRRAAADGTSGIVLMERAGEAVVRAIRQAYRPCPVAVLCGPGNNGGDGFVVARLLAAAGWPVRLGLLGARGALKGDAAHHANLWTGAVEPLGVGLLDDAGLVVDALFGAGLSRPVAGEAARILYGAAEAGMPVVAIDTPSGVAGDTGADLGAIRADLTVTFERAKPGHFLLPGRRLCGRLVVAPIGIGDATVNEVTASAPRCWRNDPAWWAGLLPALTVDSHKYTRGHALVLGGWPMSGAARLSARGAARIGAGLVTVAVPDAGFPVYATALTSIMVRMRSDPAALGEMLADKRFTAFLCGPGAGMGQATQDDILALLGTGRAVVIDADGLTSFAETPGTLFDAIKGPAVMTPHEGEFKKLFGHLGLDGADKLARARAAAETSGAVIVLKGADTVVAAPDGRAAINDNAPPNLATAGSGDVLSGFILGLLAQGMPAFEAAAAAVWLHGAAAASFGPGLISEDLPDLLPAVLRALV
jgi:NAD(P)H-hydrate epimerase